MAAAIQHQHQIKAPTPTWLLLKATPPPARGAACSPLLLSPSVWQKAQDAKKSEVDSVGLPASPRIGCLGQVKGRRRRCCSRRRDRPAAIARGTSARRHGGGRLLLEWLTLGLFGRRSGRAPSRACAKVRDVPSSSPSLASSCGGRAAPALCALDPPLLVVRRPATNENAPAPSLWERRHGGGGGKPLENLRLM